MNQTKIGDKVRKLGGGKAVVKGVTEQKVQVRHNDTGEREWIDRSDFNATWRPV